jgi:hypothetical protein
MLCDLRGEMSVLILIAALPRQECAMNKGFILLAVLFFWLGESSGGPTSLYSF